MNVCTAFDSKYFEPDLFESFQITKFRYLSENCDGAKNQRELSFAVPGTFTRLRSCIVPAEITEPPKISGGENHKYD
jgi:hypothetical protein